MMPVLWSDVQLAEAVSWFGVASRQPLVVIDGNLNATHYDDEIIRLTSSHLCKDSNVTPHFS